MHAASPRARLVYRDEALEVFHAPAVTGWVAVTFGGLGEVANGTRFWGMVPARKAGISAIGFVARRPNWYPVAAMRRAAAAIEPLLLAYSERVLYGASMGGYAAVKHSRLLHADAILACAPQISIAPEDVGGFEQRWRSHHDPAQHAGMAIRTEDIAGRGLVLYDPFEVPDRLHAEAILALTPGIAAVPLPMTGHQPVGLLASTAVMSNLLRLLRDGELSRAREAVAGLRRGWSRRSYYAARAVVAKHPGWTCRLMEQEWPGVSAQERAALLCEAGAVHQRHRRPDRAELAFCAALRADPSMPRALSLLALLRLAGGRTEEAVTLATKAVRAKPRSAELHFRLARCLKRAGHNVAALSHAEEGMALAGGADWAARQLQSCKRQY